MDQVEATGSACILNVSKDLFYFMYLLQSIVFHAPRGLLSAESSGLFVLGLEGGAQVAQKLMNILLKKMSQSSYICYCTLYYYTAKTLRLKMLSYTLGQQEQG